MGMSTPPSSVSISRLPWKIKNTPVRSIWLINSLELGLPAHWAPFLVYGHYHCSMAMNCCSEKNMYKRWQKPNPVPEPSPQVFPEESQLAASAHSGRSRFGAGSAQAATPTPPRAPRRRSFGRRQRPRGEPRSGTWRKARTAANGGTGRCDEPGQLKRWWFGTKWDISKGSGLGSMVRKNDL